MSTLEDPSSILGTRAQDVTWSVRIAKEYHKFSAAHFMIFEDGNAERLHGHNYRVEVELHAAEERGGVVIDFHIVKRALGSVLEQLDERMLVPGLHPEVLISELGDEIEFRYRDRRYLMPSADVVVLPVTNSSSEQLAKWIAEELLAHLRLPGGSTPIQRLQVSVEETPGQRGAVSIGL